MITPPNDAIAVVADHKALVAILAQFAAIYDTPGVAGSAKMLVEQALLRVCRAALLHTNTPMAGLSVGVVF